MDSPLILASGSPRRKQLLQQVGLDVVVEAVPIDETPRDQETARDYVQRMALEKSIAAQRQHDVDCIVITADTIGCVDECILVKPRDKADAFRMWQQMSGREHCVMTAVCVAKGDIRLSACVSTSVAFVTLTSDMMESYWQTGEPADKAGGYAIQGRGAAWVTAIHGSYPNVVGLPLVETLALLKQVKAAVS